MSRARPASRWRRWVESLPELQWLLQHFPHGHVPALSVWKKQTHEAVRLQRCVDAPRSSHYPPSSSYSPFLRLRRFLATSSFGCVGELPLYRLAIIPTSVSNPLLRLRMNLWPSGTVVPDTCPLCGSTGVDITHFLVHCTHHDMCAQHGLLQRALDAHLRTLFAEAASPSDAAAHLPAIQQCVRTALLLGAAPRLIPGLLLAYRDLLTPPVITSLVSLYSSVISVASILSEYVGFLCSAQPTL